MYILLASRFMQKLPFSACRLLAQKLLLLYYVVSEKNTDNGRGGERGMKRLATVFMQ